MADQEENTGSALGEALKEAQAEAAAAERATAAASDDTKKASTDETTVAAPVTAEAAMVPMEPKLDAQGRAYATGKRKNAVARVWIRPGSGRLIVNGKDGPEYFARPVLQMIIGQHVGGRSTTQFDVWCTVSGGGLSGQAGSSSRNL